MYVFKHIQQGTLEQKQVKCIIYKIAARVEFFKAKLFYRNPKPLRPCLNVAFNFFLLLSMTLHIVFLPDNEKSFLGIICFSCW